MLPVVCTYFYGGRIKTACVVMGYCTYGTICSVGLILSCLMNYFYTRPSCVVSERHV
jgi:hypothetical protein